MKKWILWLLILTLSILSSACNKQVSTQQDINSINEINKIKEIDGYLVSKSQDGEKEIYCTKGRSLVLVSDNHEKVIYENYRVITENPYSIWDFDDYKIQWSEDSNYVYIIDSIYDYRNDRLIPLTDCVIFSWIGNKGIYLAEGTYYEVSYDGGLQNEMAVGKKIILFENGLIEELGEQQGGRYYVLDEYIRVALKEAFKFSSEGYISVKTASLKYNEDQLQSKIKEEFHSSSFQQLLQNRYYDIDSKSKAVFDKIKELKEFKDLQKEINDLERNNPIVVEGEIKELMTMVNEGTYGWFNVSGKYFLEDVKLEEVSFK